MVSFTSLPFGMLNMENCFDFETDIKMWLMKLNCTILSETFYRIIAVELMPNYANSQTASDKEGRRVY